MQAGSVAQQFRTFLRHHPSLLGSLELFVEPGKFLVADAGHLLVAVNTLKEQTTAHDDAATGEHHTHRIIIVVV